MCADAVVDMGQERLLRGFRANEVATEHDLAPAQAIWHAGD